MSSIKVNQDYIIQVLNGDYYQDYKNTVKKVKNSTAIYKGEAVPFLYHPMFFTEIDIVVFQKISQMIMSIGNKVIKEYLQNTKYRKKFGFEPLLEELILIEHNY